MQLLQQSEATASYRRIPFPCVDDTDGKTPETGLTFAAGELKTAKNGGAEANAAGTVTEGAGGVYYYEATAAELNTLGLVTLRVVKAGVRGVVVLGQVVPFDPYSATSLGLTNLDAPVSSRSTFSQASLDVAALLDGLMDAADSVETGKTLRDLARLLASIASGKRTGMRTGVERFGAWGNDARVRVTANNDSNGNTTAGGIVTDTAD